MEEKVGLCSADVLKEAFRWASLFQTIFPASRAHPEINGFWFWELNMMPLFNWLPGPVRGALTLLFLAVNTSFWCTLLFLAAGMKAILPGQAWRRFWGRLTVRLAENWIFCNSLGIRWSRLGEWDVKGLEGLDPRSWYLVISNHQSWLDIVVLQRIFYRRTPFLRFFLKKELIWLPFLGLSMWALDFPFMKRYSKAYLEKHPDMKGRDLETTRKSCARFKRMPVAVMNFVEGTRFTAAKARKQESPFAGLLRPKAAGVAFVLGAMGENLKSILDVTISYSEGNNGLWAFMCGRVGKIRVKVEPVPITADLLGDYFNDAEFRAGFQRWLNELWEHKSHTLKALAAA